MEQIKLPRGERINLCNIIAIGGDSNLRLVIYTVEGKQLMKRSYSGSSKELVAADVLRLQNILGDYLARKGIPRES